LASQKSSGVKKKLTKVQNTIGKAAQPQDYEIGDALVLIEAGEED
jgi:hypothetical protein